MKRWAFVSLLGLLVAGFSTLLVAAPKADAISGNACPNQVVFGRQMCRGYYTNVQKQHDPNPTDAVFYDGLRAQGSRDWVHNADEYINIMYLYLYDNDGSVNPEYGSDAGSVAMHNRDARRNNTGAAMQIAVMLGKNGPDFNGSIDQGISWARSNFNTWANLVRSYDAKGWVKWDVGAVSLTGNNDDRIKHSTGDSDLGDEYFVQTDMYPTQVVRFINPSGGEGFQIELDCGNIFGLAGPLTSSTPTGDINKPKQNPPGDTTPPGYNNDDPSLYSSCSKISGHAFDVGNPTKAMRVNVSYSIGGSGVATASTSGSHLWTLDTPSNVRNSVKPVQVTASGVDSNNQPFTIANSPITIGPCLVPAAVCNGATISPTALDPNTPFQVTARVRYGSAAEAAAVKAQSDTRFFLKITGPSVNRSYPSVTPINDDGSGGLSVTSSQSPTLNSGTYTVTWGITGSVGAISCPTTGTITFQVTNKPYFSVTGGDISAGAGMSAGGVDCAVDSNDKAGIVSWNQGSAGNYAGAGTNFAALALNHLQDFATAQGSGSSPNGLAFANNADGDVNNNGGLFGGNFGGSTCTADYFANAKNVQTGNVTIPGQTVLNGTHKTYYVNGNVYINGPITFSGSYASPADVPSFSIIVKGNIYIAPNVTQLDGFYIAQPSSSSATNGNIYTCASSPFVAASLDKNLSSVCNNSLTVNGSFVGRQIWLLRTSGSVSSTPAEKFNYSPELWLSAPFGNGLGGSLGDYDSITSLPPVL